MMVDVTFDEFDFAADTIGGMAPAGANGRVRCRQRERSASAAETVADGDGNWFVDLSESFDLTAAMGGQAWVSDDDGDQTVAEPPRSPQFQASLTGDWVEGWNFSPDSPVTVRDLRRREPMRC